MTWLWRLLRSGAKWMVKNPLIPILVIILIIYNHVAGSLSLFKDAHIEWTQAGSIWTFVTMAFSYLFTPTWIGIGILGIISAAIVTMFEVEANFSIFAGRPRPITDGVRAIFTWRMVQYFFLQTFISLIAALIALILLYLIVVVFGLTGLLGSLILFACIVLGYPVYYLFSSTGVVITVAHVPLSEKMRLIEIAFQKKNITKLFFFYLIRIGAETAILSLALLVASSFGSSDLIETALIALIAVAPFAIIRTGGYMLKFEIFKDDPWFKSYFAKVYESAR